MTALLLAALFFEMGLALIVVPWTRYWDRNAFAAMAPALAPWLESNLVRGAVSGLGVVNVCAGGAELMGLFMRRSSPAAPPSRPGISD